MNNITLFISILLLSTSISFANHASDADSLLVLFSKHLPPDTRECLVFFQHPNTGCYKCREWLGRFEDEVSRLRPDCRIINIHVTDRIVESERIIKQCAAPSRNSSVFVADNGAILHAATGRTTIGNSVQWLHIDFINKSVSRGAISDFEPSTESLSKAVFNTKLPRSPSSLCLDTIRVHEIDGLELIKPKFAESLSPTHISVYDTQFPQIYLISTTLWATDTAITISDSVLRPILNTNERIHTDGFGLTPSIQIGGAILDSSLQIHIFGSVMIATKTTDISNRPLIEAGRIPFYCTYSFPQQKFLLVNRLESSFSGVYSNPTYANKRFYLSGQMYLGAQHEMADYTKLYSAFTYTPHNNELLPIFNADSVYLKCGLGLNMLVSHFASSATDVYMAQTLGSNLYNLTTHQLKEIVSVNFKLPEEHFRVSGLCSDSTKMNISDFLRNPPKTSIDDVLSAGSSLIAVVIADRSRRSVDPDGLYIYHISMYDRISLRFISSVDLSFTSSTGFARGMLTTSAYMDEDGCFMLYSLHKDTYGCGILIHKIHPGGLTPW